MLKKGLLVLGGVLLIAIAARLTVEVPWGQGRIPVTAQSLAVLLVAIFLQRQPGTLAVTLYVLAGAAGLPVFAGGRSGVEVLTGGSGGFLYGFIIAAFVVGYLSERGWARHIGKCLAAMTIGTLVIIVSGLVQLHFLYGWKSALEYGFYPVLPGAAIKIFLGAAIPPLAFFILE